MNKKIILVAKIFTLLAVASILIWMIFAGGCLDNIRVKIFQGNVKIATSVLGVLLWLTIGELYLLTQFSIESRRCIFLSTNIQMKLLSVRLLI
jgi:hypothetical protein